MPNEPQFIFQYIIMICPYCRGENSRVVDKRDNNDLNLTRRRRECIACKKRFTTYERVENINLNVVKRSGRIEEFNREKLKRGIVKAVKKRPITEDQIDELINDIELKLLNRKTTEIKSVEIGKMVLTRLKKIDQLGYILFSAVYNDLNTIEDLEREIKELKKETPLNLE
jgi:transcriptional repressor NrdR